MQQAGTAGNRMKFSFEEKINIRTIAQVHSDFLSACKDSDSIEIDLGECADLDLSFIQLIESARIFAATAGKSIALSKPANVAVATVLTRAGLLENFTAEDEKFWLHKEIS